MNINRHAQQKYHSLRDFLERGLWDVDLDDLPRLRAIAYHDLRVIYLLVRGFINSRSSMRAASLTFGTLLTIIPFLAFLFAIAQGLGYQDDLRKLVLEKLFPEGISQIAISMPDSEGEEEGAMEAAGREIAKVVDPDTIASIVDRALNYYTHKTNAGALGSIGLLALLYIVVRIMGTVERAMNDIWGVQKPRSWFRKITDYVGVLVLAPLIFSTVMTVNIGAAFDLFQPRSNEAPIASIREEVVRLHALPAQELNQEAAAHGVAVADRPRELIVYEIVQIESAADERAPSNSTLARFASSTVVDFLGYATYWIFLTGFYMFMPNTRVRLRPAVMAGFVAGALLQLLQLFYVQMQFSLTSYNAIYGAFAALPIFLIWLELTWAIILFGGHLCFAIQNVSTYEHESLFSSITEADREALALQIAVEVARRFLEEREPATADHLAEEFELPLRLVNQLTFRLEQAGILGQLDRPECGLTLTRPAERLRVVDVLDAVHGRRTESLIPSVQRVLEELDGAARSVGAATTLRQLAENTALKAAQKEEAPPQAGGEPANAPAAAPISVLNIPPTAASDGAQ